MKFLLPALPDNTSKIKSPVAYNIKTQQYQPDDSFLINCPSKRILLGDVVYPFAGLRTTITPEEFSSARYRKDGGGWTSITQGTYTDLLEAILFVSETLTQYGTILYEIEITDINSNVESAENNVIVDVRDSVGKSVLRNTAFRPFADLSLGAAANITKIEYSVAGATTTAKTEITPFVLFSGTHDGVNNEADLQDSTKAFLDTRIRANIDIVKNTTDGSQATITSITTTTLVGTLSGGTDNDWDTSDAYQVIDGDNIALRAQKFELTLTNSGGHLVTLHVTDGNLNVATSSVFVLVS